jgi:hypothetical protein
VTMMPTFVICTDLSCVDYGKVVYLNPGQVHRHRTDSNVPNVVDYVDCAEPRCVEYGQRFYGETHHHRME